MHEAIVKVVRVIKIANDPARRFRILWYFVAWCVAAIFMVVGAGYLVGGNNATTQVNSYHLVLQVERSFRIHGAIMMGTAAFLIYGLGDYRRITRHALVVVLLYSLWVTVLVIGGWVSGDIIWATPFWYLLVAVLTGGLLVLAPPLDPDGRRFGTERSEGVWSGHTGG